MAKRQKLEQNKQEKSYSLLARSLLTGFIGGLIWSTFGFFMFYFNFSSVSPASFILRSWLDAKWTHEWLGNIISIVVVGVISIVVALLYYMLLRKRHSMWVGTMFGIVLWGLVFYILQPIFPNIPDLRELGKNTIVSTFCLYVLYGTFIGYSISYDYNDTIIRGKDLKNNTGKKQR
ncbi:YqhR family membrane protein [Virgibacillus flavescens]|uniref:YqhR family membrane protein n=1 Tax=Virgibacillus flavescens TaxID=1611422 RepID=UPI003D352453